MPADMTDPAPELREAVNAALAADRPTAEQSALLSAYFDVTCGDCIDGRCHGHGPCGCARHEDSVGWRDPADTNAQASKELGVTPKTGWRYSAMTGLPAELTKDQP